MAEFEKEQNIVLHNRKVLEMSGVCDVSSLSEDSVEMTLDDGSVAVDGENIKIENFSAETGKIRVTGKVFAITYFEKSPFKKGGLFRKKS